MNFCVGEVAWEEVSDTTEEEITNGANAAPWQRGRKLSIPKWCREWAVSMDEYTNAVVGAKSRNIAGLRRRLPDWVQLPASVTIPFGCFEAVLDRKENRAIKKDLDVAMKGFPDNAAQALKDCRMLAMQVGKSSMWKNPLHVFVLCICFSCRSLKSPLSIVPSHSPWDVGRNGLVVLLHMQLYIIALFSCGGGGDSQLQLDELDV